MHPVIKDLGYSCLGVGLEKRLGAKKKRARGATADSGGLSSPSGRLKQRRLWLASSTRAMACVSVTNVAVLDNPARFANPFQVRTALAPLASASS